jgi:hypothetical protein
VRLADGIEMTELGAWSVDGSMKITLELLRSHGVELREWSIDVTRVEASGGSSYFGLSRGGYVRSFTDPEYSLCWISTGIMYSNLPTYT